MLSKPSAGWTQISLGEWSDRGSYLDDIPMMFLDGLINHRYDCFCLKFDAEGWDYFIVIDDYRIYVIDYDHETGEEKLYNIDSDKDELAKEVIADIESDIEGWAYWFGYYDEEEKAECEKRKQEIAEKIAKVRELYLL